ncbi:hypothetical protein D3C71_1855590 [compost metagenome]
MWIEAQGFERHVSIRNAVDNGSKDGQQCPRVHLGFRESQVLSDKLVEPADSLIQDDQALRDFLR